MKILKQYNIVDSILKLLLTLPFGNNTILYKTPVLMKVYNVGKCVFYFSIYNHENTCHAILPQ